jgi:hypothetical protein
MRGYALMSRRLATHICQGKVAYRSLAEAQQVIARWMARGTLRYGVKAYVCPLDPQFAHIGRAKRAVRR